MPRLSAAVRAEALDRFYAALNAYDWPAMLAVVHEDGEYVNPESAVEPGVRRGHAGWLKAWEGTDKAFSRMEHAPYERIEAGDGRVLVLTTFTARGRDSGIEVQVPEQHLFTFEGDKIVKMEWFHDEPAARRAAGL